MLHAMALQRARKAPVLRALFVSLCSCTSSTKGLLDSGVGAKPILPLACCGSLCDARRGYRTARGKATPKYWGCNWNHGFSTAAKPSGDESPDRRSCSQQPRSLSTPPTTHTKCNQLQAHCRYQQSLVSIDMFSCTKTAHFHRPQVRRYRPHR